MCDHLLPLQEQEQRQSLTASAAMVYWAAEVQRLPHQLGQVDSSREIPERAVTEWEQLRHGCQPWTSGGAGAGLPLLMEPYHMMAAWI
jgi:hypothetical protein